MINNASSRDCKEEYISFSPFYFGSGGASSRDYEEEYFCFLSSYFG